MARITQAEVVEFARKLLVQCQTTHPDALIELKTDTNGLFYVIIDPNDTLHSPSECYTIDPISREWRKTYGFF